jgi:hypothetical protein
LLANRFSHLIDDGSVLCIDRHLTSSELWAALIGCDLTTTPYPCSGLIQCDRMDGSNGTTVPIRYCLQHQ